VQKDYAKRKKNFRTGKRKRDLEGGGGEKGPPSEKGELLKGCEKKTSVEVPYDVGGVVVYRKPMIKFTFQKVNGHVKMDAQNVRGYISNRIWGRDRKGGRSTKVMGGGMRGGRLCVE